MKKCRKCGVIKDLCQFRKKLNKCKGCECQAVKDSNKEKFRLDPNFYKNNKIASRKKDPKMTWAMNSIMTHKRKGYLVMFGTKELSNKFLDQDCCAYCQKTIEWLNNKTNHNSPSLDNINCEKELRLDNIQLLCNECNSAKGQLTHKEFVQYCKRVYDNLKDYLNEIN